LKSLITTEKGKLVKRDFEPIHPGEILLEEFLQPMGISQYQLAKTIGVPARRINEIVHGKRAVTPDTGLRLSRAFGLSPSYWISMQARYDLEVARDQLDDVIAAIEPLKVTLTA
jgi:addiction module HigA family antidote